MAESFPDNTTSHSQDEREYVLQNAGRFVNIDLEKMLLNYVALLSGENFNYHLINNSSQFSNFSPLHQIVLMRGVLPANKNLSFWKLDYKTFNLRFEWKPLFVSLLSASYTGPASPRQQSAEPSVVFVGALKDVLLGSE